MRLDGRLFWLIEIQCIIRLSHLMRAIARAHASKLASRLMRVKK